MYISSSNFLSNSSFCVTFCSYKKEGMKGSRGLFDTLVESVTVTASNNKTTEPTSRLVWSYSLFTTEAFWQDQSKWRSTEGIQKFIQSSKSDEHLIDAN
ncbi:hypothetical protein Q1695_012035 [Nippostrongylus brasiliensis]|nr:hypothetical protein Q1695_012035 [Nippostrongylus brasiliensis]